MKKLFCLYGWVLLALGLSVSAQASLVPDLKYLPVQDAGRLKPLDTFAREALQLVYGKSTLGKKTPIDIVMTWMIAPEEWDNQQIVEIRHSGLREALRLEDRRMHYSPQELFRNERVALVFQELRSQREQRAKLNPYFQAVQRLENQLTMYQATRSGMTLRVAPSGMENVDGWQAVSELEGELGEAFQDFILLYIRLLTAHARLQKEGEDVHLASIEDLQNQAKESLKTFKNLAQSVEPSRYANMTKIRAEVHYNEFHPFMWSWILYLLGALTLIAYMVSQRKSLLVMSWIFLVGGFILHTYGMGIRSYLTGRAPVSNMYETVVWVPWGTILFAVILERIYKSKILLVCAALGAVFCLILTDLAPSVLDASLQPLEPVLRSNFWLVTHVLIITISYAAFLLAFILGDVLLFYFLKDEKRFAKQINSGVQAIYRCLQIGVVLLAAGTILGGIWADYSWGRFWGWDPKETWALIALLGYLALLHGRLVGWVRQFGLAAGSILAFSLVIMAWYGVNFVLGAGLHSYGFGAGGVEYVSAFVALHVLYVVYVATVRYSRNRSRSLSLPKKD